MGPCEDDFVRGLSDCSPTIEALAVVPQDVHELLARHRSWASEHSPPEDVHALPSSALLDPSLTLYAARGPDGALQAVGGLRQLDRQHGELKAMHTVPAQRGRGLAWAVLSHLLGVARERGYHRVSLETGTTEAFAPARNLYAKAGFAPCLPFGDYRSSPHSSCLTLVLERADASSRPRRRT